MDNISSVSAGTMGIAKGARVKDSSGGAVYELVHPLKAGHFSHVYAVMLVRDTDEIPSDERHKVAKFGYIVPEDMEDRQKKERRLNELKERYNLERKITRQIREASRNRFIPAINEGIWQDSQGYVDAALPVLIMDRMGSDEHDWSLASQIRQLRQEGKIWEAECLAVRAGAQYAELLEILHKSLKKVCPDRKPGDFYWDPANACLYVLDWNVVKDLSEESSDKFVEPAKKIQAEIRQFGEHWFEMLVGSTLSTADEFSVDKPKPGSVWSQLSRGMRRLLTRTWRAGSSQDGFDTEEAAARAWKEYSELVGMAPEDLHSRAKAKREEAGQPGLNRKREWNEIWEMISDIQALLESSQESAARKWADDIKNWISSRDRELERRIETLMKEGEESIEFGEYDKATYQFRSAVEDDGLKPEQRLKAARWCVAAQMLSAALNQSSEASKELRALLVPLIKDMEKDNWDSAKQQLEQTQKSYATFKELQYLGAENQCRLALHHVFDKNLTGSQRLEAHKQAGDALKCFRKGNELLSFTYADLLEETQNYADAIAVASELERLQKQEETRETEKRHVQDALSSIANELRRSIDNEPLRWPDNLTEILETWDDGLYAPPYLRKLISHNRIMKREGLTLRALDAAEEAYKAFDSNISEQKEVRDNLGNVVSGLGYQRMTKFGQEPRWPYKVEAGIRLGERLKNSAFPAEAQKSEIETFVTHLHNYRKLQNELREVLLNPEDVWRPELLQDEKIDSSLTQAIQEGIELFDPIPDDPEPEKIGIKRLKAAREAMRGMELQKALLSIEEQAKELARIAKNLRQHIELVASIRSTRTVDLSLESEKTGTPTEITPEVKEAESASSQPDLVPPEPDSVDASGSGEAPKKALVLPIGRFLKPALLGVVALGVVATLLLLIPISPLYQIWNTFGSSETPELIVVYEQTAQSTRAIRLGFQVRDRLGNPLSGAEVTLQASGQGTLKAIHEDMLVSKVSDQYLIVKTDIRGAQIEYTLPSPGDVITAVSGNAVVTYTVSSDASALHPTPSPTPALPTPIPAMPVFDSVRLLDDMGNTISETVPGNTIYFDISVTNRGGSTARSLGVHCAFLASGQPIASSDDDLSDLDADRNMRMTLSLAIPADIGSNVQLQSQCSLKLNGVPTATSDSHPVFVKAVPIRLQVDLSVTPNELGVGFTATAVVTVTNSVNGGPVIDKPVSFETDPANLVAFPPGQAVSNESGHVVVIIEAERVGKGTIIAQLADTGESDLAEIYIFPVAEVIGDRAQFRAGPSTQPPSLGQATGRHMVIGRSDIDDSGNIWWRVKRSDNGELAWIRDDLVRIDGDTSLIELVSDLAATPSPAPYVPLESMP